MEINFDKMWVSLNCSFCDYELDVQIRQIRLEEIIICPCCKKYNQLRDENAGASKTKKEIDDIFTN